MRHLPVCLVFALAGIAAQPAAALTCYMLLDRSENVVYRDTYPPIDLSPAGDAEREAMRNRGEHLIAMETERCLPLQFFTGAAGSSTLSVDDVVGGMAVGTISGISNGQPGAPTSRPAASAAPASVRNALPGPSQSVRKY